SLLLPPPTSTLFPTRRSSDLPGDGLAQFKGPLGLGGGQLSAFWTPTTYSIILGRRAGMGWDATKDNVAEWRLWPIHAVSGCTPRSEEHTSELQSLRHLVCRLL